MIVALVRALCLLAVRLFYRTIALGGVDRLPKEGPCIVVANHPNGLLDPVVTRLALGRSLAFLAKSTLFGNPVGRAATSAFDAIPVYRQADKADTSQNERTFKLCRDLLARRGWLMLFPEGTSHSDPAMKPLKTGAARIALSTEAANDFKLGVQIVPVGLLYEDKEIFRTRAAVAVGKPFTLETYAERYRTDERGAVEALTTAIHESLSEVVLEADSQELWRGFLAVATWTSSDKGRDLATSEARARELAQAYRRLSKEQPERASFVMEQTRRFAQVLRSVGVESPFSVETVPTLSVGSLVRFFAPLVLLAPLALIGTVLAFVPYRAVGMLTRRLKFVESDITSTVKTVLGMVFFTVAYLVEAIVAGALWGWWVGLLTFVGAPLLGYVALRYWERVTLRQEALHGWWLRLSRREVLEAVQARRRELCALVEQELSQRSSSLESSPVVVGR